MDCTMDAVRDHPRSGILLISLTVLLAWAAYTYRRLSHIPGPFLARFTNIPRFSWVLTYRAHDIHVDLHRKYGPIVRFGPNMVSVGDVNEVTNIYRFSKPWPKSDFYHALLMKPNGKPIPGIFGTQDEDIHRRLKKPVSSAYSMTRLVKFEPYVDTTMRVFCEQLRSRFAVADGGDESDKPPCDFGKWLQMFAFDVIGELTFSKRLGFLESGEDVNHVMANIWEMFKETSLVTQIPWIDGLWTNNPIRKYQRGKGASPGAAFAMARVEERRKLMRAGKNDWDRETRDFLSLFLEIEAKDANLPPYALAAWASSNITAGSDTTAILLRAIFYNLLKSPASLDRLRREIHAAGLPALVPWSRARAELPYLDAVVKEATRMHPSFGLPYERVVPGPEPAVVCGKVLPPGTIVGMSAWVVGRDRDLYGQDADEWRPERWLDEEGLDEEHRKKMEAGLLAFGAGHRSCMGKHIASLEIYKIVPTLLQNFDFELLPSSDEKGWKVENRWFVMQHGLMVRVRQRSDVPAN